MLNYTKGEWKINTRDRTLHEALRDDISIIVEHDDGSAFMVASQMDPDDAQLIAAAPELYEALKTIKAWLLEDGLIAENDLLNKHFIKANNLANKALSKADVRAGVSIREVEPPEWFKDDGKE